MGQHKGIAEMPGRGRRMLKGRVSGVLAIAAAAALCGCSWLPNYANPIEWYRDATGISKHDDESAARNQQNLEAGGKQPYPNVGSVPKPPDRATSAADRKKLEQGLATDRSSAKSSDAQLRAGQPVPPISGGPQQLTRSPPAVVATPGLAASSAATDATAPRPRPVNITADGRPTPSAPRPKPPVRRSEEPPKESSLTSPGINNLPAGEAAEAAPPAPGLAPREAPPTPEQQAATPEPKSPPPAPDESVMASPTTPPVDASTPAPRVQTAMATPPAATPRRPGKVSKQVAEIEFVKDETRLTTEDSQRLPSVLRLYQENGGTVRVVGYGRRGYGPDAAQQELLSYSKAIDRANAVAQALTKLGVPPSSIVVQAAPVGDGLGEDRAEVLLEY
jgi:outer membrane protein OmpA-like peptidoglycan-associated protein